MTGNNFSSRSCLSVLLLLTFYVSAESQEPGISQQNEKSGGNEPIHSFYGGVTYGNNMIYLGTNLSEDKPFYSGTLIYGYKNKVFLSASASHLTAFDPLVSFSSVAATFAHNLNSWFDVSGGVSGFIVNKNLTDTLFSNFVYGNISLGLDWRILYTNISAGGVLSESGSFYLNIKNSRYFETPTFMNGKAYFSLEPYVNLMFGNLTKTTTSEGTTIGVSAPFKPSRQSGQHSSGTSVVTTTYFSVIEADFGLPVTFNAGNFSLEVEPGYMLPAYNTSSSDVQSPEGFTLLVTLFYRIF
ncbi:MAG: hypothetical protein WBJ37_01715 [Bacteroidales bacterium]